jgi:hypothetical protein
MKTLMQANTLEQHWHTYILAFNASAEAVRAPLLEQSVSLDVVFTNPGAEGKGRANLSAHIGQFHASKPGMFFTTDKVLARPDKLLAIWSMHRPDGVAVATGFNFVQPDADGRLQYMAGFF